MNTVTAAGVSPESEAGITTIATSMAMGTAGVVMAGVAMAGVAGALGCSIMGSCAWWCLP